MHIIRYDFFQMMIAFVSKKNFITEESPMSLPAKESCKEVAGLGISISS